MSKNFSYTFADLVKVIAFVLAAVIVIVGRYQTCTASLEQQHKVFDKHIVCIENLEHYVFHDEQTLDLYEVRFADSTVEYHVVEIYSDTDRYDNITQSKEKGLEIFHSLHTEEDE